MNRLLCVILTFALLLCGCQPSDSSDETTLPSTPPTETTLSEPTEPEILREGLPIMDGSTSLIPLEAGIRAAIFGTTVEEATNQVSHTSTWQSFRNLLDGTVDLIFSVDLSQEQYEEAAAAGVELEVVPVAVEGFVFVVNADNPVDTLTQEQLKGIYSGQITNWSEVGSDDLPIIPYQRNTDSGSQNYMTAFMGDTPLMDAPTELRPASMVGLMDVIAVNDNSYASIGYSVYAYAADMYGNGNEIKFIQVDGVAPSKATFADRSYPLLGYNYVVFNADEPVDSPVRRLVAWITGVDGQTAIADAGYVTVTDIGYDYAESSLTKFSGTGTGAAPGKTPSSEYVLYTLEETDWGTNSFDYLIPEAVKLPTQAYRITQLADAELQDEINAWIAEQMAWAAQERPALEALLEGLNQGYDEYQPFTYGLSWSSQQPEGMDAACIITAKNGYLSVAVSMCYECNIQDGYTRHYRTETATWDLLRGQRVDIEDLFCQGVDIDEGLNSHVRTYSLSLVDEFTGYPELKRDFAGLTTSGWHMTIDTIYFDNDNPYFAHGEEISLDQLPDGVMVTEQLRDFSQCFASDSDVSVIRQFRLSDRDMVYSYTASGIPCRLLDESKYPTAAKINAAVTNYIDTHYAADVIVAYYDKLGYDGEQVDVWWNDWYMQNWGGKYARFFGTSVEYYVEETDSFVRYPYPCWLLFDLETGGQISWEDLLVEGWENAAVWENGITPGNYSAMTVDWFYLYNGDYLRIRFTEDYVTYYYADIPMDYILY